MVVKSSGQLAMSEINAEWGVGNDLNAYRGRTYYYGPNGSTGTLPGGTIYFSNFYNTSPDNEWAVADCGGGGGGCK